jgi:NAD-dependent dihydropyrimidine dehydrogenase PreA subunit
MQNRKVTICTCVSRSFIDKDKAAGISALLENNGYDVKVEADLCRNMMQFSPNIKNMADGIILACYPRTIRSHLDRLGIEAAYIVDIRNNAYGEILSQLDIPCSMINNIPKKKDFLQIIENFPTETGTDAWYPILDKARCMECGKCHDFCLFGVYSIENKKVRVTQPQNCKNNCPACARICPNKAIIFPKYEKSPINGGTSQEEIFNPGEMDNMYRERLRMRLQQRRAGIPLIKADHKKTSYQDPEILY